MADLYGYPDGQGGVASWYMQGDAIEDAQGWHNGDHDRLIAAGWLIFSETALGENQKYDLDMSNAVAFADHVSYAVLDMTAEEIKEVEDLATLKEFQTIYTELMYWKDKTDAELDTLINNYFNSQDPADIALSCRAVNKKLAKSIRDLVDIIELMRGTGYLPK